MNIAGLVVPYVGTWIEILLPREGTKLDRVVPYVGTWIEILYMDTDSLHLLGSFPTWERG